MKSFSYYRRKAEAVRGCGFYGLADEMERVARKVRSAERRKSRRRKDDERFN